MVFKKNYVFVVEYCFSSVYGIQTEIPRLNGTNRSEISARNSNTGNFDVSNYNLDDLE